MSRAYEKQTKTKQNKPNKPPKPTNQNNPTKQNKHPQTKTQINSTFKTVCKEFQKVILEWYIPGNSMCFLFSLIWKLTLMHWCLSITEYCIIEMFSIMLKKYSKSVSKLRYNKVSTENYWELKVKIYYLLPKGEFFPLIVYI